MPIISWKTLAAALLCLSGFRARAQQVDTLALAHRLADGKAFGPAAALLVRYEQAHPGSTDAYRLHLQLLYWQHQLPEAAALYARARQAAAPSLQLDYGRILYETRQFGSARAVLLPLLGQQPGQVEVLTMLGIMAYDEGRPNEASAYLGRVLAAYPDNPTALAYVAKLKAARAPYLRLHATYRTDDQPLRWLENRLEAGSYRSAWLAPAVQATQWSTRDSVGSFRSHYQVLAGNKSSLLGQRLVVQLWAGAFKHAAQAGSSFVGSATAQYQLPRGFGVEASASRTPYFYTIESGRAAVLAGQLWGAASYQGHGWQGRAQAGETYFGDGNRILGLSAWGLSPALALGPVYVKGGYSFAYNDALRNTYQPVRTLAQIETAYPRAIAGTYGAYFTPSRQQVHSLLVQADAQAGRRCWLSLRGSVGVLAQAQNPYLFLSGSGAGVYVAQGFYTEHYTPYELKAQVSYSLSGHLGLEGGYAHNRAFFYTANQVFTNLKYSF